MFLFVISASTTAQKSNSSQQYEKNTIITGLKIGANIPRMYYTNKYIKDLPHDFMIGPSLGVFVEFPLFRFLSVATEINCQKRGGATSYKYEQDYDVNYKLQTYYASLRIPFYIYYPIKKNTHPYLFVGPDAGYAFSGDISLSQPGLDIAESNVTLNKSNYNPYYFGILFGVGIRHNIILTNYVVVIKYDAAINFGFTDTFSQSEHDETSTSTNVHAYNHQGERLSRGLELSISIGLIRIKDMGACRGFK